MPIRLTEDEKTKYCVMLGEHLKRLRAIVGFTQEELADLSGISSGRISRIENGSSVMRWSQFVSFVMVFFMNANSKGYLFASRIITPRLLQALQMKEAQMPPDVVVPISHTLDQEFLIDFKIASSLSLDAEAEEE